VLILALKINFIGDIIIKIFAQKYPFLNDFRDFSLTKFDVIKHRKILQESNVIRSASAKMDV